MSSHGLTYDTGALVAAEGDDRVMWSLHRATLRRGLPPTVRAVVLAEGWRGGPQANSVDRETRGSLTVHKERWGVDEALVAVLGLR